MWERFSAWLVIEPTTPEQARAYLGLMLAAYPIVFLLATAGLLQAALAVCCATGTIDLWLFLTGKVRPRSPLSIPLGLVGMLGLAANSLVRHYIQ